MDSFYKKIEVLKLLKIVAITSNPIEQKKLHTNLPLHKIWTHYDSIIKEAMSLLAKVQGIAMITHSFKDGSFLVSEIGKIRKEISLYTF